MSRRQASVSNIANFNMGVVKKQQEDSFSLLKNCIRLFLNEIFAKCTSKYKNLPFTTQAMILFIPLTIFLSLLLTYSHLIEYKTKFVDEYIRLYESKIITPVIEGKRNLQVEFLNVKNKEKIESNYNFLIFYKIYSKELLEKDFFIENTHGDIHNTWNSFDNIFIDNFDFSINEDELKNNLNFNYSYNDDDVYLKDFIKIFYLYTPLFMQLEKFNENHLMTSYVLVNPLIKENKKFNFSNTIEYFQFPTKKHFINYQNINFKPFNFFSDPVPNSLLNGIKNENLDLDNWYSNLETKFLDKINYNNENTNLDIIYSYEIDRDINTSQTYLPIIQFTLDLKNGTKLSISIISKYERIISDSKDYQYFSFLNLQDDLNSILSESRNRYVYGSNLISDTKLFPFVMPEIYENFFRQGMLSKNNSLQYRGINLDLFEFKNFNKMDEFYNFNQIFIGDQLIYSVIYFYNSFFLKLKERLKNITNTDSFINYDVTNLVKDQIGKRSILLKTGRNDTDIIQEVCNNFNITNYVNNINSYLDVDCFGEYESNEYRNLNMTTYNEMTSDTGLNPPNCFCIPFYCIKLGDVNERNKFESILNLNFVNFDSTRNYNFVDEVSLPAKCFVKLSGLLNSNDVESIAEGKTDFIFQFIGEEKVEPLDKSMLNVYMISYSSHGKMIYDFFVEVEEIVYYTVFIYSLCMVVIIVIISSVILSKSQDIYEKIKDFELENKMNFITSQKEPKKGIKQEEFNKQDILNRRRENVFDLRSSAQMNILGNNNPRRSRSNINYSKMLIDSKDGNVFIKSNTQNFLDDKFDNKPLATIKEFNEGLSSENQEVEENDESVLINENILYEKEEHKISNNTISRPSDEEDIEISILSKSDYSSDENDQEEDESNNSFSEHDSNLMIQTEENKGNLKLPEDIKKIAEKQIKHKIKNSVLRKLTTIKEQNNNLSYNNHKVMTQNRPDELNTIMELVRSNTDLFKLDFNLDKNINEKQIIIDKYKNIDENLKKFKSLFDSSIIEDSNDNLNQKELSKVILYEVVSTEFCNYQGMCLNWRFKYNENTNEDLSSVKKFFISNNIVGRRKSSCLAGHITNIKKKLKLIEKETIFDFFNEELEKRLLKEDQTIINFMSDGTTSFHNLKSIINFYLENIHLQWIKQIYEDKFAEELDN